MSEEEEELTLYEQARLVHNELLEKKSKSLCSILLSTFGAVYLLDYDLNDPDTELFDEQEFGDVDEEFQHLNKLMAFIGYGTEALRGRVMKTKKDVIEFEYEISGRREEEEKEKIRRKKFREEYEAFERSEKRIKGN